MGEHDEDEEAAQVRGGQREEIDGDQIPDMGGEERAPGLGRRFAPLGDQPGDSALCDIIPSFRSSPWISGGRPRADSRRPFV